MNQEPLGSRHVGTCLLTSLDTEWTPPEGVKRISDIKYEQILKRRRKKRKA